MDALGVRVRRYSDSYPMTDYRIYMNVVTGSPMAYTATGSANIQYILRSQVDSTSAHSSWKTNGRWTP